ncbi:unnamed protein product [Protopolystoma xenopodis]|uniref:Uncharacterized protein n=1 Tax=Protopolystoma xenopodis TaxID=117903 RepID=A0A448WBS2_9PLAT|nr:unnamed protein product [Protopolystoma xenopodis]
MEKAELASWINHLLTRSGYDIMPIYKKWSTKSPSIQGIWHPFMTHTDSGRAVLTPEEIISNLEHLSRCEPQSETAESKLVHISDVQKHRLNS